tara:strand:- start:165 stop:344 length:180 start_codon:yes stop_codon:yes gene_type:complete
MVFIMEGGAASVIRTRDLTLTKGALYRWSYSSTWLCHTSAFLYMQVQGQKKPARWLATV